MFENVGSFFSHNKTFGKNSFKQVVKYPTHIRGRLIDHFYHNLGIDIIVNQYTPYFTDHDGICVIIPTTM